MGFPEEGSWLTPVRCAMKILITTSELTMLSGVSNYFAMLKNMPLNELYQSKDGNGFLVTGM